MSNGKVIRHEIQEVYQRFFANGMFSLKYSTFEEYCLQHTVATSDVRYKKISNCEESDSRYFDLVYALYQSVQSYVYERGLYILDDNVFIDFFEMCLRSMNYGPVDSFIQIQNHTQIRQELKNYKGVDPEDL